MKYLVLLIFLVSCVQGEKKEVKSKLNYLNGENYSNPNILSVDNVGIPVGGGYVHNKATLIEGALFVKEGLIFAPLNHEKILLKNKKGKILQEIMSGAGGQFTIVTVIKNGVYQLEVLSSKYQGQIKFDVKTYEIKGLKLVVKRV